MTVDALRVAFSILFLFTLIACNTKIENAEKEHQDTYLTPNQTLTDSAMTSYLEIHQADFDTLCKWIIEDKLEFMLLNSSDTRHLNRISEQRATAYFDLMEKLGIDTMARGNAYRFNTIIFYLLTKNKLKGEIEKGYVYKIDSTIVNEGWIKTDEPLLEAAYKYERNTFIYKPIDEHWSLVCLNQID